MKLPLGFRAAGVACGLKESGTPDLGLLVSDRDAVAAGVFTTNRVQAAPVRVTRTHLRSGTARGIVANAGNANACTGPQGLADARAMTKATALAVGVRAREVLVASTGIIGVAMNMQAVYRGIDAAAASLVSTRGRAATTDARALATAIMTTDTHVKIATARAGAATITGVAKGAAMMAPEMATMLCFIATDAAVDHASLTEALRGATHGSFNALSLDACRSTNDCVIVLANGASNHAPDTDVFAGALAGVCASLAKQIAADGEGATKIVTVRVTGARTESEARTAARAVADSVLLRCALHGADPNWGRVMAALGTSGVRFNPDAVDVWLGGQMLCQDGAPGPGNVALAAAALRKHAVEVRIELHRGEAASALLTNDLSPEYVRLNADYST